MCNIFERHGTCQRHLDPSQNSVNLLLITVSAFARGKKYPVGLFQRLIKMCKCQNWKKQLLFSV